MGWDFTHREKGEATNAEWFTNELLFAGHRVANNIQDEMLAHGTVGNTFYAAVKRSYLDTGVTEVFGLVALTQWVRGDWHNFGYKAMEESMGPNESRAPAKVLDALDAAGPPSNEYAADWRARCRENLARRERAAGVKPMTRVRFARPITFSNNAIHQEMTFVKRSTFRGDDGLRYSVANWRDNDFEVVS